jgi:hypothetical protein
MKNSIQKKVRRKTFKQAVEATNEVRHCFREGKQAIKNDERDKVELSQPRKCGGSLFIDQCLVDQNAYPNDNRWDYAIDYNREVYFFEVHTASTKEVSTVLKKLEWLKSWLHHKVPEINSLRAERSFYWIQSNGYHILPNSSQEKLVKQKGLKPISKLLLK